MQLGARKRCNSELIVVYTKPPEVSEVARLAVRVSDATWSSEECNVAREKTDSQLEFWSNATGLGSKAGWRAPARAGHGPPRGPRSWGEEQAGADVVQAEGVACADEDPMPSSSGD
eukprot:12358913-Alexandrium_andersonii.AAC.1